MDDTSDQARFAEVFLPHLVDAFRLARWIAGSRADAEDIVQEASMRAFKNIRGFSGGDPRAWVLTIVRNMSYSWLAKNRPKALVLSEDLDQGARERIEQEATNEPQTPETALIAKLEAQQVRKAMALLPVPFREVLVLRESTTSITAPSPRSPRYRSVQSCQGSRAPVASSQPQSQPARYDPLPAG